MIESDESALALVSYELASAREKWPCVQSRHEGYAVILEELDEYWEECRKKHPNHQDMTDELVQVAAMAIRTIVDTMRP